MSKHIFTTSAGVEIPLKPIPPLQGQMVEQAARKKAAQPDMFGDHKKPTYTIKTDDGGEELHEHDETTIAQDAAAKRAWDAWQECERLTSEYVNNRLLDFALSRGTDAQLPEDDSWIEEQENLGIDVPEAPAARRTHYIRTELIGTVQDLIGLQNAIRNISGISEEMLAAARATFSGDAPERGQLGVDALQAEPQARQLDGEPTLFGNGDGEGVGENP